MKHDYTDEEILYAWNHRKYLPGQMGKTLDNLKAFLAALAESEKQFQAKVDEVAKLLGQIDHLEERDRQGREELVRLRAELRETRKSEDHWHSEAELLRAEEAKAQAELAALRQSTQSAQPILADDGRSLGQVAREAWRKALALDGPQEVRWMHVANAVIAAAKGEGQANEIPQAEAEPEPEKPAWILHDGGPCPLKDEEVEEWQAKWISGAVDDYKELAPSHAAGWDGSITHYRVFRWKPGFGPEAKTEPATKEEPATFEALGKTWTRHTPGDPMPCDGDAMVHALLSDDMADDPPVQAKNMQWDYAGAGDVIGWRYADEPAQAQPWTPAVGQTVRLKSGGPVMTVVRMDSEAYALWMNGKNIMGQYFPAACLTPSRP